MSRHGSAPTTLSTTRRHFLMSAAASALMLDVARGQEARQERVLSPYAFLTQDEAEKLQALADRIIPSQAWPGDKWPSASEAGVVSFIDFQLAGLWGHGQGLFRQGPHRTGSASQGYQLPHVPRELYRAALAHAHFDGLARKSIAERDRIVAQLADNSVSLGDIPGQSFFAMLRQNVIEGYFSDPMHGGNRDYAGWRMIGFPGAHAYYLTDVDRFGMHYTRPPTGVAAHPGLRPAPFILRGSQP